MHHPIQCCLNNAARINVSRAIDVSIAFLRTRPTIECFVSTQLVVNCSTTGAGFAGVGLVHNQHIGVFVIASLVQESLAKIVVREGEHDETVSGIGGGRGACYPKDVLVHVLVVGPSRPERLLETIRSVRRRSDPLRPPRASLRQQRGRRAEDERAHHKTRQWREFQGAAHLSPKYKDMI